MIYNIYLSIFPFNNKKKKKKKKKKKIVIFFPNVFLLTFHTRYL